MIVISQGREAWKNEIISCPMVSGIVDIQARLDAVPG